MAGGKAAVLEHTLQRVENFRAVAQRLGESGRAPRHDHELLEIDRGVRVGAAVEDVHHRYRQRVALSAAEVAKSGRPTESAAALGGGQRDGEHGVGAELAFVRGAVEVDHGSGRSRPGRRLLPDQFLGDLAFDVVDGLGTPLPP